MLRPGDLIYSDEAFDPWNEGPAANRTPESELYFRPKVTGAAPAPRKQAAVAS